MSGDERADWPRVAPEEMRQFAQRCLTTVGMKLEFAQDMADVLVAADYRGHYSHGLNRLGRSALQAVQQPIQGGPGGPGPQDFFHIMQFSGSFKGKHPILSKFWAQGCPHSG